MTEALPFAWPDAASFNAKCDAVPPRYQGVWMRSLLDTVDQHDNTTFVRWMQLGHWHADLRICAAAMEGRASVPLAQCNAAQLTLLTQQQQGFCGMTEVTTQVAIQASTDGTRSEAKNGTSDICTWHRLVDYHPPQPTVDAGTMIFEGPDCVVETGIHGQYLERWHRLPGSSGRAMALTQVTRADALASVRLFIAGKYMMRVQPRDRHGPDFDISFGVIEAGIWHIERSTMPQYEGQCSAFSVARSGAGSATVMQDDCCDEWEILEWIEE
jgi:hypothetical protein